MKIIVTGATGFIGPRLVERLHQRGDQVTVLARNPQRAMVLFPAQQFPNVTVVSYDPLNENTSEPSWHKALEGCEGVINLAGAPIAGERWTSRTRQQILNSRVVTTKALVKALGQLATKPKVMISGSAIGYYGTDLNKTFEEYDFNGNDFPAQVCREWEAAAAPATDLGIRLVTLRTGIVMGTAGGALAQILPIFQLGAGGILGTGRQWFSWIHQDDLVNLIIACLEDPRYNGPVNGTAPQPVTNREFTETLAQVLGKFAILPTPALVLNLVFGESANLLLEGQRVIPRKAIANNFGFQYPDINSALVQVIRG